jgi:hypothetical protein
MGDKRRRANLLYRLRRKGVEAHTKTRTIYCKPSEMERVKEIGQVKRLSEEFGFAIQLGFIN